MLKLYKEPEIKEIKEDFLAERKIALSLKREDEIHPLVSGNKWRKLKYNLLEAKKENHHTLLTFGGAYSNHIYATAAAAEEAGLKAIGIIRGEEHLPLNPTLTFAMEKGMRLIYMDRTTYRNKKDQKVIEALGEELGDFYLIPEGGTNNLAIKGCEEMVSDALRKFNYICVPVGTGGTMTGLVAGMQGESKILGFSSLKGDFLQGEVTTLLKNYGCNYKNWKIINDYHFGGYAKVKPELMNFIHQFKQKHHIQLEPIYTGKMVFGLFDMITQGYFPEKSKILAIHTGGLQGNAGIKSK